jgi:hypothetical protein
VKRSSPKHPYIREMGCIFFLVASNLTFFMVFFFFCFYRVDVIGGDGYIPRLYLCVTGLLDSNLAMSEKSYLDFPVLACLVPVGQIDGSLITFEDKGDCYSFNVSCASREVPTALDRPVFLRFGAYRYI